MRTFTCKHKIWGENWLYLRPYLKAFPVFNVLKTCREYFLTIDLIVYVILYMVTTSLYLDKARTGLTIVICLLRAVTELKCCGIAYHCTAFKRRF